MKTTLLVFAGCFLLTIAATAQFAQKAALLNDPAYTKNCTGCHGKDGDGIRFGGKRAPNLADTQLSLDEVKAIITNGKDKMPSFRNKITQERIFALAAEIKDFSKR